jgi:glycine/D-amino acid oxidase-like deaminating enzyme
MSRKSASTASVHALPASIPPEPARRLGEHGLALWRRLNQTYDIGDEADRERLLQVCEAVDLVQTGDLDARSALAGRNFICKVLKDLFPDEPQRGPGRPPKVGGAW